MKKLLSFVLTTIVLISLTIPVYAHAAEAATPTDDLETLACQIFPEYADKIRNPQTHEREMRSSRTREIVVSETRSISDTAFLNYTESSDGLVLLSEGDVTYEITDNSYTTEGRRTDYTISLKTKLVNFNSQHSCQINNITYSIYDTTYDRITSAGTVVPVVGYSSGSSSISEAYETAFSPAKMTAKITYRYAAPSLGDFWDTYLTLTVQNNSRNIVYTNPNS